MRNQIKLDGPHWYNIKLRWWLHTAEQTCRLCWQRIFWRLNVMSSMGIWITQWKTKPPQFTTHTECTSGSGNPFSWGYLETGRGTLHMHGYFLFVAISLHVLLADMTLDKTWSWFDPVWLCSCSLLFPFHLSQKSDALKFDFIHKLFGIC